MTDAEATYLYPPKPITDTRRLDWMAEHHVTIRRKHGKDCYVVEIRRINGLPGYAYAEGSTPQAAIDAGIRATEGAKRP